MGGCAMKKLRFVGCAAVVVMLLSLVCVVNVAMGQKVTAEINGAVTDPSGAPVAGARVSAKNVATGIVYPTETNSDGVYYLAQLPVGGYEERWRARGFGHRHIRRSIWC